MTNIKIPAGPAGAPLTTIDLAAGDAKNTTCVFSKESGPDWLIVSSDGKITGIRPDIEQDETTAIIKMSTRNGVSQMIAIDVGRIEQTKPIGPGYSDHDVPEIKVIPESLIRDPKFPDRPLKPPYPRPPSPLTFTYSPDFDIPAGYVDTIIDPLIDVTSSVSGGTKPYTFKIARGPNWVKITTGGILNGTRPGEPQPWYDEAVITVTDSANPPASASVTINVGPVLIQKIRL